MTAGGGDDDWGAFEGDDAERAAMPAPAHQHANGFASASSAAPFRFAGGWSGFGAGPTGLPPANSWGGGAAPAVSAVLSTDETGHRRGVSSDRALPEDLFSEPAEPAPATAAAGPAEEAEDDGFGDFADAEPVPPAPSQQPAQQPGIASLSTDWPATGPQQNRLHANAGTAGTQQPSYLAIVSGEAASPAELAARPAAQLSSSAAHNTAPPGSAAPVRTVQPSEPERVADTADDGFADFGAFAEAEPAAGGDSGAAVQPSDALWHGSPPGHVSSLAPVTAAAPITASAKAQSAAVSLLAAVVPSASFEPAPQAAGDGVFGSAPQLVGAEAAEHRRGVSRCTLHHEHRPVLAPHQYSSAPQAVSPMCMQ